MVGQQHQKDLVHGLPRVRQGAKGVDGCDNVGGCNRVKLSGRG